MPNTVSPAYTREDALAYKLNLAYDMSIRGAAYSIDQHMAMCHVSNVAMGWWSDLEHFKETGEHKPVERNVGELLMLITTELSEAFEGHRTNQMSDKIPEFTAMEEELADVLIRLFDTARAAKLRLGEAYAAKFAYNQSRKDHTLEARAQKHGKQF
jgi:NTP pyrophosphatase (non-canonical NTP hydrolase)